MRITQTLFYFSAVALAALGIGSLLRLDQNSNMKVMYIIYAVLMFGDALAMLLCGYFINRKIKSVFWFAALVPGLNIALTIFDQFGWIDLLFVLLNIVTLISLFAFRKDFLPQ